MSKFFFALACAAALWGCAARDAPEETASDNLPRGSAYVVLPANFIMEIEAGKEVVLNPHVGEFTIFRTPEAAESSLREEISAGKLARGDWRIYRLGDDFSEVARTCGRNRYCLARETLAVDWIDS